MTTIVYRDGILAADTGLFAGSDWCAPGRVQKIWRIGEALFGGCGTFSGLYAIKDWVEKGRPDECKPKVSTSCHAVCIWPDNELWEIDADPELFAFRPDVQFPYFATGSGYAIALGALFQGATAIEAVRAAARHDTTTRLPIDWLDMHGNGGRVE